MNETLKLKRLYLERENRLETIEFNESFINPLHWIELPEVESFKKFNEYQRTLDRIKFRFKGKTLEKIDNTIEVQLDYIQGLKENWDGEGADAFKEITMKKTKIIIVKIMNYFIDQQIDFSPPKLSPLSNGSLDISWKNDDYRLYINIPEDENQLIELYGDAKDHPEDEIDCRFHYELIEETVIKWLKKILRYGR